MARQFWVRPAKLASYLFCFSILTLACSSDGDKAPEEAVASGPGQEEPANEFDQAYQEATRSDQNSAEDMPSTPADDVAATGTDTAIMGDDAGAAAAADTPAADATADTGADAMGTDSPAAATPSLAETPAPEAPAAVTAEEEVNTAPDFTLSQAADNGTPAIPADSGIANEVTDTPSLAEPTPAETPMPTMEQAPAPSHKAHKPKKGKHGKKPKMAKKGKKSRKAAAAAPADEAMASADAAPVAAGEGKGQYIVQPGDSISKIAARIYGSKKSWRSLAKLNGLKNPKRLYPGDVIVYEMSDRTAKFDAAYKGIEMQEVVVKSGDTLARIAARTLGTPSAWKTLWKMNRDTVTDPNKIEVGTKLKFYSPKKLTEALRQAGLLNAH